MVVALLVRGHLRTRWRRYARVAASFGVGLFAFFLVVMITDGARDAIVRPLGATITGDMRVTEGTTDAAGGRTWEDYRPLGEELGRVSGARVAPRYESSYITVRGNEYDNWSAGLLLGIDPTNRDERASIRPYLAWGRAIDSIDVFHPTSSRAYVPLILGEVQAKRLSLELRPDGEPNFDQVLTITSGRLQVEGTVPVPLLVEAVVVGVFDTGLEPLDKFTAFVPIHAARVLGGHQENDPIANALLVHGAREEDIRAAVSTHPDHEVVTAAEYAFDYMGSLLVILYGAAFAGLGLFMGVLLVWLVHETGVLVRTDRRILSSLRAIGIPARDIHRSYTALTTASVAAGAVTAFIVALLLGWLAPPLEWSLSGLDATIPWRVRPLATFLATLVAVAAAFVASWITARRIERINIRDGLGSD